MKKYLLILLLGIGTMLNAYSNVSKIKQQDVTTWYFTCNSGERGSVNYQNKTQQYYANSQGAYPYYSSMQSAANKECEYISSKINKHIYGYIKKGAVIFSKQTGKNSIEWALGYAVPEHPENGNMMKIAEMHAMYGELPTNGKRKKMRLYKKYTKPKLLGSYWKIKDGNKIKYIADKDISM